MIYNWDGFGYWEDNVGRLATKRQPEYPHLGVHRPNNLGNLPFGESRRQHRHGLGSGRHLVPAKGQYLVHWAFKFYSPSDTAHTSATGPEQIRYAYTPDLLTFSMPQTLIFYAPTSIINLYILPLSASTFVRSMKNESASNVFMEVSTNGLFGSWTRPGGKDAFVRSAVEGPHA
jgi:hypothetical protein